MKKQRNKVSKRIENNTQAIMVDDYGEIELRCLAFLLKYGIKNANKMIYGGTPLTVQHFPYGIQPKKFKP